MNMMKVSEQSCVRAAQRVMSSLGSFCCLFCVHEHGVGSAPETAMAWFYEEGAIFMYSASLQNEWGIYVMCEIQREEVSQVMYTTVQREMHVGDILILVELCVCVFDQAEVSIKGIDISPPNSQQWGQQIAAF